MATTKNYFFLNLGAPEKRETLLTARIIFVRLHVSTVLFILRKIGWPSEGHRTGIVGTCCFVSVIKVTDVNFLSTFPDQRSPPPFSLNPIDPYVSRGALKRRLQACVRCCRGLSGSFCSTIPPLCWPSMWKRSPLNRKIGRPLEGIRISIISTCCF